jgi:hypothetical protein
MRNAGLVVVLLLGARTFYLYVQQVRGLAPRYHVETSAVLFVLAGLLFLLFDRRSRTREAVPVESRLPHPALTWAVFVAAALALYWPAIGLGLLSDDYILWAGASAWSLGPVTPSLFRPLPLLIWGILIHAAAPPAALHLLNITLHGTNAFLTSRLCEGWTKGRTAPLLAGGLMIAMPLGSEPVAWAAGIFDLSATALLLSFALIGRSYGGAPTRLQRAAFIGVGILALGAKETAAIGTLLVLTDAWIRRSLNRPLLVDTGVVFTVAAGFAAARVIGAFGMTAPSVTKYEVQRALFETFGGLSVPFHLDVIQSWPWLAILGALAVMVVFTCCLAAATRSSTRVLAGGAAWILISILPVFQFIFVGPDLQGARFLYLAAPGWVSVIACSTSSSSGPIARRFAVIAASALVVFWALAARAHLEPWKTAALSRDRVIQGAKANGQMQECRTVRLEKLPDSVRGAYVFRNGAPEALRDEAGLEVTGEAQPDCRFVWSEPAQAFSRAPE